MMILPFWYFGKSKEQKEKERIEKCAAAIHKAASTFVHSSKGDEGFIQRPIPMKCLNQVKEYLIELYCNMQITSYSIEMSSVPEIAMQLYQVKVHGINDFSIFTEIENFLDKEIWKQKETQAKKD